MVPRPARSVHQQIRLRRRIHFNAAVPPDPFPRSFFYHEGHEVLTR